MSNKTDKGLILLLGNYRPSLTLARDFTSRGFRVAVGSHGCERLCQYSNAVSFMWTHSAPNGNPMEFAWELKSFADARPDLVAIVPVAEEYVRLIAENETLFTGLPKIISMDAALIRKCLDKEFMLKLAQSHDVPTMPFAYTAGLEQALEAGEGPVGYPLIMRPKDSTKRLGGNKAVTVNHREDLIRAFNSHCTKDTELLIQRRFEGKRHNVYFAAVNGTATRLLHAVIDRTDKPDATGLAVEGRTLECDHPLIAQTATLLKALNYSGIGCAQFLVDDITGTTSFLEINPRIAGNHALPEYAGLGLGWFNFQRVAHGRIDNRQITGRAGLRYCWTSGDLMGAKLAYMRSEIGLPSLLAWSAKAVLTGIRCDLHMVFSFADPYPAIRGLWKLVPRIARWRAPETSHQENRV